jgi:hypothetical protein
MMSLLTGIVRVFSRVTSLPSTMTKDVPDGASPIAAIRAVASSTTVVSPNTKGVTLLNTETTGKENSDITNNKISEKTFPL